MNEHRPGIVHGNVDGIKKAFAHFDELPSTACERDKPEIVRALDALTQAVEKYDIMAGKLGDRLSSVVTPPPPEEARKSIEYQTPLASSLGRLHDRIHNITANLQSLYERIEL